MSGGFASGLHSGMSTVKGLADIYNSGVAQRDAAEQKEARQGIMKAAPEQAHAFNPEEFAQVQAAVDSGQYDVDYDAARKGYTVAPKADPSQVGFVGQGPVTRFLGQDYQGQMAPEQVNNARYNALADVEMKFDPGRGLQMRREVRNHEREDKRFEREEKEAPLKQRAVELQVSGAERAERDGVRKDDVRTTMADALKEYDGSPEQIGPTAQFLNGSSKRISMGMPDNKGFVRIAVTAEDNKDSTFLKLNRADQAQLYAAGKIMEVDPERALQIIGGINKELAAAIASENDMTGKLATNANDVANKSGGLAIQQQNANTNEAYRRQMGAASQARAGGSAAGGKPVKMEVQTIDPVTGKPGKVTVLMNPATGQAITADGKPFTDSAALDRAFGRMSEESQLQEGLRADMAFVQKTVADGTYPALVGETPLKTLERARAEVQGAYDGKRDRLQFRAADEAERTEVVRGMASAGAKSAEIAAHLGASEAFVKSALGAEGAKGSRGSGLPPPSKAQRPAPSETQQAYDAWQGSRPSWFQQSTPMSSRLEKEAEARYLELLRNPGKK